MAGQYLVKIVKKEQLGKEIFRLTLHAPEIATTARPGQFVMLRSGGLLDPLLGRPFSLHQCRADGSIQVLFKVFGAGTKRLAALAAGDQASLIGPLGRGFDLTPPAPGVSLCLVGGGMGIAPLFLLAQELKRQQPGLTIELMLGARNKAELHQLADEFRLMGFSPLVATDDGSLGYAGLVPDLLALNVPSAGKARRVYCCGPKPMMAVTANYCQKQGWDCQVSLETMMACGISACLGCAVKGVGRRGGQVRYLHACKDGPVFNALDLDWTSE
ncbi:MAG: dihydroorotate dehydrogenase electron transfer subunit [Desulfobulbaceae bacterium]|nr:MAG: dihydroorotate dehydrogenase electron transfer subunit [Desulfobulbaceae bacterium]